VKEKSQSEEKDEEKVENVSDTNEEVEDEEDHKKTARGRPRGATSYTIGDIEELLVAVEHILPKNDKDWEGVSEYYFLKYAKDHGRCNRTGNALKNKFHDLVFGPRSGGGKLTPHQERARKIERLISEESGVVLSEEKMMSEDVVDVKRKGSRTYYMKNIMTQMEKTEEAEDNRFKSMMKKQDEQFQKKMEMESDSAFPIIPGRVERSAKRGELEVEDLDRRDFQLQLEEFSSRVRIASEWGIEDLKHVWHIMSKKLPSDDTETRRMTWLNSLKLYNLRRRVMSISQIASVFNDAFSCDVSVDIEDDVD
jgi:hypothetical protein